MGVRIREPAQFRCKGCDGPYQLSWSDTDKKIAKLTVSCGTCGTRGSAQVDRQLALESHLLRPGSEGARALMDALAAAACEAES
jgi:hypothetical protein